MKAFCPVRRFNLSQKREITKYPDCPSLRRSDEIVTVNEEITGPGSREILAKRLPMIAIVETHENTGFIADVKESGPDWIGPNYRDNFSAWEPVCDLRPGVTCVMGSKDLRLPVVDAVRV